MSDNDFNNKFGKINNISFNLTTKIKQNLILNRK